MKRKTGIRNKKTRSSMKSAALYGFVAVAIGFVFAFSIAVSSRAQSGAAPEFGADGGPESEGDPDIAPFGMPAVLREDDPATDPGDLDQAAEILPERYLIRSVPWRAPDFQKQEGALGWSPSTFSVPPELKDRVAFWKLIYAKYTTDQGILHDIDDVTVIYEPVDFTSIMRDSKLSAKSKARARTRHLNATRSRLQKRLEALSKMKKETDLKDARDRELLQHFTKQTPAVLFSKESKKELKALKEKIAKAAKIKRIRFQLGQRDKFILGVYYSGRYMRQMEKIFRAENLPIELTRLPFVESSFNIKARSRVGASGIWQFMPRTAKPWMMVNRDVDERNDPLTATAAAARLMKSNFDRLGSWPLALTAYNHGASGLVRAIKKTGSRDLAVIIEKYESRRFGFASSNFFACFLAALEVEKEARELLGDVKWSLEFDGAEIDLKKPLPWRLLVEFFDGEGPLAELQNPHITDRTKKKNREIPKGTFVRVPATRAEAIKQYFAGTLTEEELRRKLAVVPIPRMKAGESTPSKLGALTEAARALIPFLNPSPTPVGE
ncbi:MAG: lytic transglycosylase domain-containing protein [Bdellovibrionales bacterium]|nr:lytic transglycosylase domain-containing protein [Bdellovibrionales bacterium]